MYCTGNVWTEPEKDKEDNSKGLRKKLENILLEDTIKVKLHKKSN